MEPKGLWNAAVKCNGFYRAEIHGWYICVYIYMYERKVVVYYSILAPHFPFVSLGHECEFRKSKEYTTYNMIQ